MSKDSWRPVGGAKGEVDLSDPQPVTGTLREPGFLILEVMFETNDGRRARSVAGARFEPERLEPSLPPPDDFVEFWANQKRELSDLPMNPRLTPVECDSASVELYDLQLDCPGGAPVSGYYARPRGQQPGTCPAILFVHVAGVRSSHKKGPVRIPGPEGYLQHACRWPHRRPRVLEAAMEISGGGHRPRSRQVTRVRR